MRDEGEDLRRVGRDEMRPEPIVEGHPVGHHAECLHCAWRLVDTHP